MEYSDDKNLKGDDKIIAEAKKNFKRCEEWESYTRVLYDTDLKFANADPDNHYQWPQEYLSERQNDRKPCLTINKVQVHNLYIINDAKQNKPGVNVRPVGGGATYESAQSYEGIIRHIEYISTAETVYDWATTTQVQGGIGYWRIITDYPSPDTFDQEIYIRRIKDPRSVYLDPDINEVDGSDSRFGFIFEDVSCDRFEKEYPAYKHIRKSPLGIQRGGWVTKDTVRVAEYYRQSQKADKLVTFIDPYTGEQVISRWSQLTDEGKEIWSIVKNEETSSSRDIIDTTIEWYKIAGNEIIDRKIWPGKYIPIVRVIGIETVIDGILDRKGHTRAMKDAQRLYNYWSSNAAEFGALQSKSPYVAPVKAVEGLENYWKTANTKNHSYLPYNSVDEDGNIIPPPNRQGPPVMAPAYIQGMEMAQNEMMMASGQYQAQFGQNENATSGLAINARQRQGDKATYHFIDNQAIALRFTGKILIDLIPKVYDTPRVIQILNRDGSKAELNLDPNSPQVYKQWEDENKKISAILNPMIGQYDIVSDVGPSYATKRQEAFNALTQMASQNPRVMEVAGDVLFRVADFPEADVLAERWANIIPPHIKGEDPDPMVQQQIQQLQGQIQHLTQIIERGSRELQDKSKDIDIKAYEAETKRLTALGNAGPIITAEQIRPIVEQILGQMLNQISPVDNMSGNMPVQIPEASQPVPDMNYGGTQ